MTTPTESGIVGKELAGALASALVFSGAQPILFGIQPVRLQNGTRAAVKVSKPPRLIHEASGLDWPIDDGWVAQTWHVDHAAATLDTASGARQLLDEALEALNVAVQWLRVRDQATTPNRISPWHRRFGRVDVRGAIIWDPDDRISVFINPHKPTPDLVSLLPIGDMIVTNGPLAQPTAGLTDRFAGALDLLNHGFLTEAVLVAFAAFEGWLRRTLSITLAKGNTSPRPSGISKRVRDASFKTCLVELPKRCGWQPIDSHLSGLEEDILRVYGGRNQLMHEALTVMRRDAEWCLEQLAQATAWLRSQRPDIVPDLPPSNLAVPTFFQWKPGDPSLCATEDEADPSDPPDKSADS